ncbi:MAG: glycosyltransferase family 4 protein [Pseudodesulfovibrio sp.]|uniref:glycosyltransferase family 4 protein n=1 Tax=Pseudodesulfovibrio sp. TaxID=2035812 RepID=UPI003D0D04C1
MRARILHLRPSNFVGGPEKMIFEHFKNVDEKKYHLLLGSFQEENSSNPMLLAGRAMGFDCLSIETRLKFGLDGVRKIARVLRDKKIDVLVAHGYKADILGRLASWMAKVPLVIVSHGWTGESCKIRWFDAVDKLFCRAADAVVAVSEEQGRRLALAGVPARRIHVIKNCIQLPEHTRDRREVRERYGIPEGTCWLVAGGRLSPEKNFGGLIEAVRRMAPSIPDFRLSIFGEGPERRFLTGLIDRHGLRERVRLHGFTEDFPGLLAGADLFVLSSLTEGLPVVVLEAMAYGIPVVATDAGGTREVVSDGETGVLVPLDDPQALADALVRAASDGPLRERLGKGGFELVNSRFTFAHQACQYEGLYDAMIGKGAR